LKGYNCQQLRRRTKTVFPRLRDIPSYNSQAWVSQSGCMCQYGQGEEGPLFGKANNEPVLKSNAKQMGI
jgi:hypothetical protein